MRALGEFARGGKIDNAGAMPELPEVETTVRGLARYLEGETLTRVITRRADLRRPFPPELAQVLTGARPWCSILA